MIKLKLHWQILIALLLAVFIGIVFPAQVKWVSWMGVLFLKALKMVIIPLIFTSIASGIVNLGTGSNLGRLSAKVFSYYGVTSIFAIVTGLLFANLIKPGVGITNTISETASEISSSKISIWDTLLNIIPENIMDSWIRGGLPTRQMQRNEDYLRRCQEKSHQNVN